jgi:hypothetical protein
MFADPSQIVSRKSPGKLDDWICFVVGAACLVTFLAVTIGVDLVFHEIDRAVDRGWVPYGLVFIVAFCVLAAWLPPAKLSRALRVAVMLPAVHALVLALAWPAWQTLSRFVTDRSTASPLVTAFPIALVAGIATVAFIAFASLVARRRSGEWLHGFIMLALTELLLLGLWLPISCALWPGGEGDWWSLSGPILVDVASRAAFSVIPPTVVALAFTAFALRRPTQLLAMRRSVIAAVAGLLLLALAMRIGATPREMVLYSNLMPMLLTAMIVAIAALMFFGIALAIRNAAALRALRGLRRADGVITLDDDAPVLGFEITSWLRGPRIVQRPFAVSIARSTIPVRGAHLVAALPAATTQLRIGESYAVLRPGDRVTIAGHRDASGDPFRTSAAPLAGEIYVAPAERAGSGFTHVALAMWRPCVAYLLIVVAVALPALAALAAA